ncbi:hypothetical protein CDIK_3893 [Cucumispora dikerogammari]|nr:hypothetical protein CDIK_3893 [Cucumispora dikerogammari]
MSKILVKIAMKKIRFFHQEKYTKLKESFLNYLNNRGPFVTIDKTHINIFKLILVIYSIITTEKAIFQLILFVLLNISNVLEAVSCGFEKCHDARIYRGLHTRTLIESISDPEFYVIEDFAYSRFNKIRFAASTKNLFLTPDKEYLYFQQRIVVENSFGRFKEKFKPLKSEY